MEAASHRVVDRWSSTGLSTVVIGAAIVLLLGTIALSGWFFGEYLRRPILILPTIVAVVFVGVRAFRRLDDRQIRKELAQVMLEANLRPALCLHCSYDLQGVCAETCPECGQPLAPVDTQS